MRKKIAFLYSAGCEGGLTKNISLIINYLNPDKFECLVYCLESEKQAIKLKIHPRIKVTYLDSDKVFSISLVKKLIKLFEEDQVKVISTHGYKANFYTAIIRLFKANYKVLTIIHGWVGVGKRLKFYHFLDQHIVRFFDQIIVLSASQLKHLKRIFVPEERISLIPNGIDALGFQLRVGEARDLKHDERFLGKLVIACCARLASEKKIDVLIKAYSGVARNDNCLVIVGNGSEREALENLVSDLGLQDQVYFVGFQSDVLPYYKLMDIYVTASKHEGMPNSVLEAMSASKAIIASDLEVHEQMLAEGAGLIFSGGNIKELTDSLRKLLNDENLRSELGEAAFQKVNSSYSLEQRIKALEESYSKLC